MAYQVQVVAVAATGTLIWQTSTGQDPDPAIAPTSGIYPAGTPDIPRNIMVIVATGATLEPVTAVGGSPASNLSSFVGPTNLSFSVVGNSQFVGAISGTGHVTVLVDY